MALLSLSRALMSASKVPLVLTWNLSPRPGRLIWTAYSCAGAASGLSASASAAMHHVLPIIGLLWGRCGGAAGRVSEMAWGLLRLGPRLLQGAAQRDGQGQ